MKKKLYEQMVLAGLTNQIELFNETGYSSSNLFREISVLTEQQQSAIQQGFSWVQQKGLQDSVVIIGGTAVVCHIPGGRSLTPDLDLLVTNVAAVEKMLDEDGIAYTAIADAAMERSLAFGGVTATAFNVDFMAWENRRLNAAVFSTAGTCKVGGATWKVIDPALLMCLKAKSGRPKDMDDMRRLWQSINDKDRVKKMFKSLMSIGVLARDDWEDMSAFMF